MLRRSTPKLLIVRRVRTLVIAGCLVCGGVLAPTQPSQANGYADLIHVLCVPELGLFEFSNVQASGREAVRTLQERPDEIAAKYGLYDLRAFIDFESVPTRFGLRSTETRKANIRCDLDGSVVDVVFEPEWLPPALSYRVTLRIDGRLVMDDLPFQRSRRKQQRVLGILI